MQAPDIQELTNLKPKDKFSTTVQEVKEKSETICKKTFSLHQSHLDYINKFALLIGQSRGKVVGASEALRMIVEKHQEETTR